ncbi:MAG: hypothetical protein JXQ26_03440 [Tissierellales bacterium]|nr:hypothetical protein [Tissierellales bacterium]
MYKTDFSPQAWKDATGLLLGAYDLHIHNGPSIFPRRANDLEILQEAASVGMAGVGIKTHEGDTAPRAKMLEGVISSCKVYGGITLNHYVGGINPAAVEASLKMGGRIVWLPTLSAKQHVEHYKIKDSVFLGGSFKYNSGKGISIFGKDGKMLPKMADIFTLVRNSGIILSTGHLSPIEALAVAKAYHEIGGEGTIVYGHPDLNINQGNIEAQKEFVSMGGIAEKCTLALHENWGNMSIEDFVKGIKEIGVENCYITTDAGDPKRPSSPETLTRFIALALQKQLLTEKQIRVMLVDVPRKLLAL